MHHLANLPEFIAWFALAAGMLVAFVAVHGLVAPWAEWALLRAGNIAATAAWAGALLGYALVLAAIISGAQSHLDLLSWGVVGLAVQLLALGCGRLILGPAMRARVEAADPATGLVLAALALAAGIINAATMLY